MLKEVNDLVLGSKLFLLVVTSLCHLPFILSFRSKDNLELWPLHMAFHEVTDSAVTATVIVFLLFLTLMLLLLCASIMEIDQHVGQLFMCGLCEIILLYIALVLNLSACMV